MKLGGAALLVAVVVGIAGAVVDVHGHLPPGGYAVVGVLAGLALVAAAKLVARAGLQRP
ncbi:MAG: hypothetical protein FJ027_13480, partial [Candidatus Rokubacteria bacterium]|nr:hypothetical protein [Candidatus Rokubacteria bacterium]